ncbi:MAG: TonB-dependent receptor [Bacteroidota bacterium]
MKWLLVYTVFLLLPLRVITQNQQFIRGHCVNESTQRPVPGAIIYFSGTEDYKTETDTSGNYEIAVQPGIYRMMIEHPGFKSFIIENIRIDAGKQQVQNFELIELMVDLSPVTVKPAKSNDVELSNWHLQQYAAVFYDPARVVSSHAGVVNSDDQANHLTIRGTSPNYIQWKIEGVEVVNPNHLENSGTLNDRPALNGGGVSMISAQLLETSGFHFAPFNPLSGNALSGIFDLKLRTGNEKKMERTVQASFLGTDICLEGPFSKKSKTSYLINFRYSTIGLLSKLGVNFGDEKTNYKDLSFLVAYPMKHTIIKLFGIIGNSETLFKGKEDSSKVEIQKELHNINYHSFTAIGGLNVTTSLSNTLFIKTVLAYSTKKTNRTSVPSSVLWLSENSESDDYQQEKISAVSFISKRISHHTRMKAGSYVNVFTTEITSTLNNMPIMKGKLNEPLVQPFISLESSLLKKFELQLGLHGFYQPRINYFSLQPRAMVKYTLSDIQDVAINYGEASQLHPGNIYLSNSFNINLKPVRSRSLSFSYNLKFRANTFKTEIYYKWYDQLPVNSEKHFSSFNYFNEYLNIPLTQNGKAKVSGVDFIFEKQFKGFYIIPSVSIYNSSYTTGGDTYYDGRFNTNYNAVLTTGKEFRLKDGRKFLSADLRAISRNGYKETRTNDPDNQYHYDVQLPSYFRIDLRFSYRKNRERSTVIWALDIQNASNTKNVAYHYYDSFTQKTETRYQLGLIPVLSYKILF